MSKNHSLAVSAFWFVAACSSTSSSPSTRASSDPAGPVLNGSSSSSSNANASAGSAARRNDGGASRAASPSGEGSACNSSGETRSCCANAGHQTCSGTVEFLAWGPCLDRKGAAASCKLDQPSECGAGEFSAVCDAGVRDAGWSHECGDGEFGPDCKKPALCENEEINTEPEILVGYSPTHKETVGLGGQIKVWINDERPALIALDEQVDAMTGMITKPGDRTGKAPDGYLWEPALYIAPETAENGGTPHFPQQIKGWYNNMPPYVRRQATTGVEVPNMEPAPAGAKLSEHYSTELIWDVNALGLAAGTYTGEFVIHDGDRDRAIGCVTITISN